MWIQTQSSTRDWTLQLCAVVFAPLHCRTQTQFLIRVQMGYCRLPLLILLVVDTHVFTYKHLGPPFFSRSHTPFHGLQISKPHIPHSSRPLFFPFTCSSLPDSSLRPHQPLSTTDFTSSRSFSSSSPAVFFLTESSFHSYFRALLFASPHSPLCFVSFLGP